MSTPLHQETLCIQAGYTPENGQPRQIPIIQSTTFQYATSEDMGKLFDLEAEGYFYSRLQVEPSKSGSTIFSTADQGLSSTFTRWAPLLTRSVVSSWIITN